MRPCENVDLFIRTYHNSALSIPHVAECYQHTLLVAVPTLFLLACSPLLLYTLQKSKNERLKCATPNSFRILACLLLILDTALLFAHILISGGNDGHYNRAGYAMLQLAALGYALFLMTACRNRGVTTSGVLFNFWLLLALCGLPEFYYKLRVDATELDGYEFWLYMIYYPLVVSTFLLSCFVDRPLRGASMATTAKTCPESSVSFLNQITFNWFNGTALLGHRRALEMKDLWELDSRDSSEHLVPKFERVWSAYLKRWREKKASESSTDIRPQRMSLIEEGMGDKNGRNAKSKEISLAMNGASETEALQVTPAGGNKEDEEEGSPKRESAIGRLLRRIRLLKRGTPKKMEKMKEPPHPSVLWPLFLTYRWAVIGGGVVKLCFDLLQFASPQLLKWLISFIEDRSQPMWVGVGLALAMFGVALLQSMLLHQYFHLMFRLGMNVKTVLTAAVYKKALRLSSAARRRRQIGEIVNLMAIDIQRFQDITNFMMLFWSSPLQVLLAIFFLWRLLGVAVVAGLAVLIALIPINWFISKQMRRYQMEQMRYKDERLKLISEMLNGMKVLKLYAWEPHMQKRVLDIRTKEVKVLKRLAYLNSATALTWACAPFLVAVLTFGVYVTLDPENNVLTPQITFVGLSLFNILRFPLAICSMIVTQAIQCSVSNRRLKAFFDEEELEDDGRGECGQSLSIAAIDLRGASFSWDREGETVLRDLDIHIPVGSLVAVVGRIGSGKSSLLSALLGEMHQQGEGTHSQGSKARPLITGRVAYVPQQAWVQNATLKNNVTFGLEANEQHYQCVLDACALRPDLESLPAGDQTEIGEKGINLSGGQKQRVSLARACYSNSDVYLLDDPLSAVDAHVGKWLFEKVIHSKSGLLRGRTRVLVTHSLPVLKYCDQIIVMRDGRISESGTYEALMASAGEFAELLEEYLLEETKNLQDANAEEEEAEIDEVLGELGRFSPAKREKIGRKISEAKEEVLYKRSSSGSTPSSPVAGSSEGEKGPLLEAQSQRHREAGMDGSVATKELAKPKPTAPRAGRIIEKEEAQTGKVKMSVYASYLGAIGWWLFAIFITIYILASVLGVASNLWLADWSDHAKEIQTAAANHTSGKWGSQKRLGIYTALGLGQATFVSVASIVMAMGMVHASRSLHEGMLVSILRAPMAFFDVTPLGRILNRFGKDVDMVDTRVPVTLLNFVGCALSSLTTFAVPMIVTPQAALPMAAIGVLYFFVMDLEMVDKDLPLALYDFVTTALSSIEPVAAIAYAIPNFVLTLPLFVFGYGAILDVDVVDASLPRALLTFVRTMITSTEIVVTVAYAVPNFVFVLPPLLIIYGAMLDINMIDVELPDIFGSCLRTVVHSINILLTIAYATPNFVLALPPMLLAYSLILRFYVSTSRQLKRLESVTRSPIYSHFQESVQGASSIRAYAATSRFERESQRRVDYNLVAYFPSIVANRWLAVRLELVGNVIVFCAALFAVLFRDADNVTAGMVGLSVAYALSITQTLNWAVRMTSELEANIVSVERIDEYSTQTPREAAVETSREAHLPDAWPSQGEIRLERIGVRYRRDLDLVLRDVDAHIHPREKVGIIGRTGAGKSSLTLALFRIVELDTGRILIDGVDISKVGLHDLRSRLTIVPQDPVLVSGTLRENLDPFGLYEAAAIWQALELTSMDTFVRTLVSGLEHRVSEGGENLSVGQRQLICLARALLRKSKVLVLDEAAASVDIETDHLIQKTIREQFRDCTILTIAHRLHSVLDSDRLLVFDAGRVVEFDTPMALMQRPGSVFNSLATDAGITAAMVEAAAANN